MELAVQVTVVVALTAWVKYLAKDNLGQWAAAVAMGAAFIVVLLYSDGAIVSAYEYVKDSVITGLSAAGFYKGLQKIGGN